MQSNGNSLYRHGVATLKVGLAIVAQMEASRPVLGEDGAKALKGSLKSRNQARFDALKVGDSMDVFGICAVVAKKNAKSVVTTSGTKYTTFELGVI